MMTDTTNAPAFSDGETPHAPDVKESVAAPVDYTYVRLPDGSVHAVETASIVDVASTGAQVPTAVSDAPRASTAPVPEAHFYVWLANGDVERVKESDLPTSAGTNAPFGHWQRGSAVFVIVGVYPVEDNVSEGK